MKYILVLLGAIVLLIVLTSSFKPSTSDIKEISIPTLSAPTDTPTDTPIPTATPIPQQTVYFTSPLYCPQIYIQGVTPCVNGNKTPVACVAQFHPDGSPVINLICGIPGNSDSVKGCVNYAYNPNVVICP